MAAYKRPTQPKGLVREFLDGLWAFTVLGAILWLVVQLIAGAGCAGPKEAASRLAQKRSELQDREIDVKALSAYSRDGMSRTEEMMLREKRAQAELKLLKAEKAVMSAEERLAGAEERECRATAIRIYSAIIIEACAVVAAVWAFIDEIQKRRKHKVTADRSTSGGSAEV